MFTKALKRTVIGVVALLGMAILIGVSDIVLSVIDDNIGVLTSRAIKAVQTSSEAGTTIGAIVAKQRPTAVWTARHDDDDSLDSVKVAVIGRGEDPFEAEGPQWCVSFGVDWWPFPRPAVRDIAPANRAGQLIAPTLSRSYGELPKFGQFSCSAVRRYFRHTN